MPSPWKWKREQAKASAGDVAAGANTSLAMRNHDDAQGVSDRTTRAVRVALLAAAATTCAAAALEMPREEGDARAGAVHAQALNLAERQRMLSQRLVVHAASGATAVEPSLHADALDATLGRLLADREVLAGLPLYQSQPASAPDEGALVLAARQALQALRERDRAAAQAAVALLSREAEHFLAAMERTVQSMEAHVAHEHKDTQIQHRRELLTFLLGAALLLLGTAEWLVRRLGKFQAHLQRQSDESIRLATVAELTYNAVILTDPAGRVTWVNAGFTRITGYTLEYMRGRTPGSVLQCEATDPSTKARLRAALAARKAIQVEIVNRARCGRQYWLQVDIQPHFDASGRCSGFIAVETDITEQRTERDRLSALVGALPVGVVQQDATGAVRDANPEACRILGLNSDELIGLRSIDSRWDARDGDGNPLSGEQHPAMRALLERRPLLGVLISVQLKARRRWLRVYSVPQLAVDGQAIGVASGFLDVTEYHMQSRMLGLTVDAAGLGTWDWNLDTSEVLVNDRWWHMLGREADDLPPTVQSWRGLLHPLDAPSVGEQLQRHLADASQTYRCEFRMRHASGGWTWVMASGSVVERDLGGRPTRMVGIHLDISQRKQLEDRLVDAAMTDSLTGLPNRAALLLRLQACVDRVRAQPEHRFAVLLMDFDRFKLVNDALGHDAGDDLLCQVARRLELALSSGDTFGRLDDEVCSPVRLGGDEFVVVLERVRQVEEAALVAQRLLDALARPFDVVGQQIHGTVSIGIAVNDGSAADPDGLLRDADTAMYEAKRRGRGRFVVFSDDMHERVRRAMDLEADLRQALQRKGGELFVVYQPIVNLKTGRVSSAEALVRWSHPTRGAVPPVDFIPVAEEHGLIAELGAYVLEVACRDAALWKSELGEQAPAHVSVNLSRAQIQKGTLASGVANTLAITGLAPQNLRLEITESVAIQEEHIVDALRELRALGVTLALDDFGTGHSSLASLDQFPLDSVKIDRAFVQRMMGNRYQAALIKAVLDVAASLGLEVVAEGVETEEQAALLMKSGCVLGQGWLFGRPMAASELLARMTAGVAEQPRSIAT